jgi:hypothetical protein
MARRPTQPWKIKDVYLTTPEFVEETLGLLRARLSTYGKVTVADYYDLVGVTVTYADIKRGWTDLTGCSVSSQPDGSYKMMMPEVKYLP